MMKKNSRSTHRATNDWYDTNKITSQVVDIGNKSEGVPWISILMLPTENEKDWNNRTSCILFHRNVSN